MSATPPSGKVLPLAVLESAVAAAKAAARRVVLAHGVFDLLHIGHIKHLQAARALGDVLVVTVTPDRFVNKGPHRPAFPERLRAEALAALACVDYVAVADAPTCTETIRRLRPDVYVKGRVEEGGARDHTDAIVREEEAVNAVGGRLVLTEEPTYASSALINRFLQVWPAPIQQYLDDLRGRHRPEAVVAALESLSALRVLVVGETIVDTYRFCEVMAKANKDPILSARYLRAESYAGGVMAVANHAAVFAGAVRVLSAMGADGPEESFVRSKLAPGIAADILRRREAPTIVKERFLEEYKAVKLFEVNTLGNQRMQADEEEEMIRRFEAAAEDADVVIVTDYGHGLMTPRLIEAVCGRARFLALNTQANAANRGFNSYARYPRADLLCIQEDELRLEARDPEADVEALAPVALARLSSRLALITRGERGCLLVDAQGRTERAPAFVSQTVDRIGAGDAVLAVAALCAARGLPLEMTGLVANVVGAEACTIMGNARPVDRTSILRSITSLLK